MNLMLTCMPRGLRRAMVFIAALTLGGFCLDPRKPAHAEGGRFTEFAASTGGFAGSFRWPALARLTNGNFVLATALSANVSANTGAVFQI
jgi:hypothetical protein